MAWAPRLFDSFDGAAYISGQQPPLSIWSNDYANTTVWTAYKDASTSVIYNNGTSSRLWRPGMAGLNHRVTTRLKRGNGRLTAGAIGRVVSADNLVGVEMVDNASESKVVLYKRVNGQEQDLDEFNLAGLSAPQVWYRARAAFIGTAVVAELLADDGTVLGRPLVATLTDAVLNGPTAHQVGLVHYTGEFGSGNWDWIQVEEWVDEVTNGTGVGTIGATTGLGAAESTSAGSGGALLASPSGSGEGTATAAASGQGATTPITGGGSGSSTATGQGSADVSNPTGHGAATATSTGTGAANTAPVQGAGLSLTPDAATGDGAGSIPLVGGDGTGTATTSGTGAASTGSVTASGSTQTHGSARDLTITATLDLSPWSATLIPSRWAPHHGGRMTDFRRIHRDATEYVTVQLREHKGADLTGTAVSLAIGRSDSPPFWRTAETVEVGEGTATVRLLVSPADLGLLPGTYSVLAKAADEPETAILYAGLLQVTG